MGFGYFVVAVCLWWVGARRLSKWELKESAAAPVVPCGCCVLGLAPAHTAAVWLSVWAAGITGRPFTPAQTVCLQPISLNARSLRSSALSIVSLYFLPFFYPLLLPCSLYSRLLSATLLFVSPNLSVFLSPTHNLLLLFLSLQPSPFPFQLTQKTQT